MISVSRFVSIAEQVAVGFTAVAIISWIAVNPFWQYRNKPVEDVAAHWRYSAGSQLLMSPDFYWKKWQQNDIDKQHVTDKMVEQLQQRVSIITPIPQWQNLSRLVDKYQQRSRKMRWNEEVVLQISQTCGLFMQFPKRFQEEGSDSSLYSHWLTISRADRGIETLMDEGDLNELFAELPDDPHELIKVCQASFMTDASDYALQCYCQALISDVWGWAAALAYQDARQDSQWVFELLCIRLAWEYLLWHLAERTNTSVHEQLKASFNEQLDHCFGWVGYAQQYNELLWKWQTAYERSQVARLQFTDSIAEQPSKSPDIQAVFCIDVRSERYRRALEKAGQAMANEFRPKALPIPGAARVNSEQLKRRMYPACCNRRITLKPLSKNKRRCRC